MLHRAWPQPMEAVRRFVGPSQRKASNLVPSNLVPSHPFRRAVGCQRSFWLVEWEGVRFNPLKVIFTFSRSVFTFAGDQFGQPSHEAPREELFRGLGSLGFLPLVSWSLWVRNRARKQPKAPETFCGQCTQIGPMIILGGLLNSGSF